MMDYELFKDVVSKRIQDFLPPIFNDYQVNISKVRKINEEKDALTIVSGQHGIVTATPNIYLNDMYEEFQACPDLEKMLQKMAALIVQYTGRIPIENFDLNFSKRKDSIIMNLINTERNRELLADIPHRELMDLSVIYKVIMDRQEDGMATVLVNNEMLKELNLTEPELSELAYENTVRQFPVEIVKLTDLMYVMTNEFKVNGATTLLYSDAVKTLAERVGGSFFIIPSSIHEIIAVPDEFLGPDSLIEMLEEGNQVSRWKNEVLSNSIYHYDKDTGQLIVVAAYYNEGEMAEA